MEGQIKFSLILESRVRGWLQRDKRDRKKGKSRKLNKQDLLDVEEELKLFSFVPDKFLGVDFKVDVVKKDDVPVPPAPAVEAVPEKVE